MEKLALPVALHCNTVGVGVFCFWSRVCTPSSTTLQCLDSRFPVELSPVYYNVEKLTPPAALHCTEIYCVLLFFSSPSRVNANLLFGESLHPLEHCTVVYGLPLLPAAVTAVSKHFRIVLFRSLSLNRMGARGFFTAALLWHQSGGDSLSVLSMMNPID